MLEKLKMEFFYKCFSTEEISKEEVLNYVEKVNLQLPRKNPGILLLLELIKENFYEQFYQEYKDKIYIPFWELAKYWKISATDLSRMEDMGMLKKYKKKEKEFYSKKLKENFKADTFELAALELDSKEIKSNLEKYYKAGTAIRIENNFEKEAEEIINTLKSRYEVIKNGEYGHRSGEGSYVYVRARKITDDPAEINRYTSEIERLSKLLKETESKLYYSESEVYSLKVKNTILESELKQFKK